MMEMPCRCDICLELFELTDGYRSEKWMRGAVICAECHEKEAKEIEREEDISNYKEQLEDAQYTVRDAKKELKKLGVIIPDSWVKADEKLPEENVGVLVFIPEEDNHITSGMWDVSKKWVLLDEYREVSNDAVTHWMELPEMPIID